MFWGNKDVIAVGGGKGGIGKSTFVANLGVALARQGKRVVVVDADIGAANLHTIIGVMHANKTLDDFIRSPRADLSNSLLETPYPNLRLLSSASDLLGIASPNYRQRQKLYRGIQKLDVDVVIFDIAAGTHQRATDFFGLAPLGVIIVEPIPTSLENAFSFLKNLIFRFLLRIFYDDVEARRYIQSALNPQQENGALVQFGHLLEKLAERSAEKVAIFRNQYQNTARMLLVVNAIRNQSQGTLVAEKFTKITKRYLALNMQILGTLPHENSMDSAIISRTPFIVKFPQSGYTAGMENIASNMPLRAAAAAARAES